MRRRWNRNWYPIDWPQLSLLVRKDGLCCQCQRPHMAETEQAMDGRWRVKGEAGWRDDHGQPAAAPGDDEPRRKVRVIIAAAHRDHRDASMADLSSLMPLCARHHLAHDRAWSRREARLTWRAKYAIGDLFGNVPGNPWPARYPR